jgi:hypothetical protein
MIFAILPQNSAYALRVVINFDSGARIKTHVARGFVIYKTLGGSNMGNGSAVPQVPQDNEFHSTGEWTEWKCLTAEFQLIHARVKCLSPYQPTYKIQFRNYYQYKVLVKSSASSQGGDGKNDDAQVPGKGGVSVLTKVACACGNVQSPDVYITVDEVIQI